MSYYSSTSANTTGGEQSSLQFPFTVPATTQCNFGILVVPVALMKLAGNVSPVASVTWGATNLTYQPATAGSSDTTNDNARKRVEMWTLTAPSPGAANVTITMTSGQTAEIVGGAIMACGVDQAAPFVGRTFGNNQTANNLAQVGLLSAPYALLLDVIATNSAITSTVGNGETTLWNLTTTNLRGHSSGKYSASSFEVPTYSLGSSTLWALGALTLKPWTLTAVDLESFDAQSYGRGALLRWHTGFEASNLGFRVYRERDGTKVAVGHGLIAGSALSFRGQSLSAGYSYSWWDPDGRTGDRYWLEDVGLGGASSWHGPFEAVAATGPAPRVARARTVSEAARAARHQLIKNPQRSGAASAGVTHVLDAGTAGITGAVTARGVRASGYARPVGLVDRSGKVQWQLAGSSSAIKVVVDSPGWYQVS
ncbi:MAG: hypothetical protein LJE95_08890, partial [Acidobacteria bacterium]|nr:hypothetical protein [Acidobacteriota bacterium]